MYRILKEEERGIYTYFSVSLIVFLSVCVVFLNYCALTENFSLFSGFIYKLFKQTKLDKDGTDMFAENACLHNTQRLFAEIQG